MYLIGVDIGGTFTDLVIMDGEGRWNLHKTPSTPDSPEEGAFTALALAAEEKGVAMRSLLEETRVFVHGTTLVTNAVISGNMAKTALLTNEGYEDMLFFGLGSRGKPPSEMFKTHQDYPDPIIPRHLIAGIRGRINAEGGIETELDEAGIRAAVAEFKRRNVESLAVSFLWSITNPEHEERARAIIAEEYPEAQVSIGHQITSVVREYERTSTCSLDASIKPLFGRYVKNLIRRLKENGYERDLLMVNSHGGVVKGEELTEFPVYALKSGPSLGPVAGMTVSEAEGAEQDLIVCDMGGTSFDASMVVKGEVVTTLIGSVGPYHYSFPTLDVHSIGAGGGSIAWVDSGGLVHVGPQSAGSSPGPACYDLGGDKPTVTDANVVLGYISPDYFMGGKMRIDADKARAAIQKHVAGPLGQSVEEAANLIYSIVNHNMVLGLSEVSIQKGIDPRGYLLVGGGGCSAAHLVAIATELGMTKILIPRIAPGLCAFGMLAADLLYERAHSFITRSDSFEHERVNELLASLEEDGDDFLARASVAMDDRTLSFSVMAQYPYQSWDVEVPLPWGRVAPERLPELVELFHEVHKTTYGFTVTEEPVQFVSWRVKAQGRQPKARTAPQEMTTADASPALKGSRPAYFTEARDYVETQVYAGEKLRSGNVLVGPAIIEEPATTVVVPAGFRLTVTRYENYYVEPEG